MIDKSANNTSQKLDHTTYTELYASMVRIRSFEERLREEYASGEVPGFVHLYCGEEAIAAGVGACLRESDYITSTHRGHGHCIVKNVDMPGMVAEILGRRTGLCKGKGGSMHIADFDKGMLGANGIVGGGLGIACGAALSAKSRGTDQVAIAFFGDGATAQGIFYEAMNLAAVWQLPVVFVCENNRYAEASPFAYHSAVERASQRAKGVGIPGVSVDGMDVLAVYTAADEAIERARSGGGPTLIEGRAYRYYGHAEGDAQRYKPCGEEEEYQARDPVETFGRRAVKQGWLTEDDIATIKQEVQAEVDEAWSYGLESPMPDPVEVYEDVYADYELQG